MTEKISLYYQEGNSDKVYLISLEEKDKGYVVNFAFGRKGSTLQAGTKTDSPVEAQQAKKIYDSLIKQKMSKGYKVDPHSSAASYAPSDRTDTGIRCQLLSEVTEEEAELLLTNEDYIVQEKHNGMRKVLIKKGIDLKATNREGLLASYPDCFNVLVAIPGDFIIDGESVNETFYAFDLLEYNGTDMRAQPYTQRLEALDSLLWHVKHSKHIVLSETTFHLISKRVLFDRIKAEEREGIVFKRKNAPYIPGRSASGDQLKYKLYDTASFIVAGHNNKRSVSLSLFDMYGKPVAAGNVAIPVNYDIPPINSIVEVRYLYAFKESGSVYQPTYYGVRDDVKSTDCTTTQMVYKPDLND